MPTRAGRHGLAYTHAGKVNLRNAKHATDMRPLDPKSSCPAARDYSRAYLHHLVRSNEILGMMLLTWNNLAYYQELMVGMREAIAEKQFADFKEQVKKDWLRVGDSAAM
jgi:queuine tRNA-ribosyltransferase